MINEARILLKGPQIIGYILDINTDIAVNYSLGWLGLKVDL